MRIIGRNGNANLRARRRRRIPAPRPRTLPARAIPLRKAATCCRSQDYAFHGLEFAPMNQRKKALPF
jgi:hypothetical protein